MSRIHVCEYQLNTMLLNYQLNTMSLPLYTMSLPYTPPFLYRARYARVNALKKKNPKLKTLLSVGGWNFGTLKMTAMMKTRANMNLFTRTSIKFLRDRNFDGLDLDFEYPGSRGSPSTDKHKFTVLLSVSTTGERSF